jgi:uncharacterized protein YaiI (UPF0178 family)
MTEIYVDADACPVKQEVIKVAKRYQLSVTFVSNLQMRNPDEETAKLIVVDNEFNAADDWIADHVSKDDIVITGDIPLASRCIKNGARVIDPTGRVFSEATIGQMLATRDLMSRLRETGVLTEGPAPFQKQDRSRFVQALDQMVQNIKRSH